jgi:regulator of protease activity HflC (stomatin/prohibitin superfamily)
MTTPADRPAADPAGPWAESAAWAFRFLFFLVGAVAVGWACSGVHRIPADSQAVVFRFGRLVRTQGPGLLLAWPAPVERVVVLPAAARQIEFRLPRLDGGGGLQDSDDPDGSTASDEATYGAYLSGDPRQNTAFLLTGDSSVVHLQATLFYQISDPVAYAVADEHVAPALQRLFIAGAVATIAGRDLDTVLVARPEAAARPAEAAMREQLRHDLMDAVNRRLDDLARQHAGLGVQVSRVDVTASIPSGAKAAFDHVLTVTQEAQKDIAQARTQAELKRQATSQQRDRIMAEATARADERVSGARTHTASIEALGAQSRDGAHGMLMQRLYNDRAGALFRKIGQVETVDPDGNVHAILPGDTPP